MTDGHSKVLPGTSSLLGRAGRVTADSRETAPAPIWNSHKQPSDEQRRPPTVPGEHEKTGRLCEGAIGENARSPLPQMGDEISVARVFACCCFLHAWAQVGRNVHLRVIAISLTIAVPADGKRNLDKEHTFACRLLPVGSLPRRRVFPLAGAGPGCGCGLVRGHSVRSEEIPRSWHMNRLVGPGATPQGKSARPSGI